MIALHILPTDSKFSKHFSDWAATFISTNTTTVDGWKEGGSVKAASSVSPYVA